MGTCSIEHGADVACAPVGPFGLARLPHRVELGRVVAVRLAKVVGRVEGVVARGLHLHGAGHGEVHVTVLEVQHQLFDVRLQPVDEAEQHVGAERILCTPVKVGDDVVVGSLGRAADELDHAVLVGPHAYEVVRAAQIEAVPLVALFVALQHGGAVDRLVQLDGGQRGGVHGLLDLHVGVGVDELGRQDPRRGAAPLVEVPLTDRALRGSGVAVAAVPPDGGAGDGAEGALEGGIARVRLLGVGPVEAAEHDLGLPAPVVEADAAVVADHHDRDAGRPARLPRLEQQGLVVRRQLDHVVAGGPLPAVEVRVVPGATGAFVQVGVAGFHIHEHAIGVDVVPEHPRNGQLRSPLRELPVEILQVDVTK